MVTAHRILIWYGLTPTDDVPVQQAATDVTEEWEKTSPGDLPSVKKTTNCETHSARRVGSSSHCPGVKGPAWRRPVGSLVFGTGPRLKDLHVASKVPRENYRETCSHHTIITCTPPAINSTKNHATSITYTASAIGYYCAQNSDTVTAHRILIWLLCTEF